MEKIRSSACSGTNAFNMRTEPGSARGGEREKGKGEGRGRGRERKPIKKWTSQP